MTSKRTSIEWTASGACGEQGRSWQVTRGCSSESRGCQACYAERIAARFSAPGKPFEQVIHPRHKKWNGKLLMLPASLSDPFSWRKPSKVFVNSMSDLFHENVPDDYIAAVFAVMGMERQHTFQVLTKRASRMRHWFDALPLAPWHSVLYPALKKYLGPEEFSKLIGRVIDVKWPLPNVWLGVSVEDQRCADERIPEMLRCPAAVHFLSCEPLLGPVDLRTMRNWRGLGKGAPHLDALTGREWDSHGDSGPVGDPVSWVIIGGESGPQARSMALEWAEDLLVQCKQANVPVFVKQLGAKPTLNGTRYALAALRDRKGVLQSAMPQSLRVRDYPQAPATSDP